MNSSHQTALARLAKTLAVSSTVFAAVITAQGQDKIVIRGSNTIGEELAPHLIAEYKKNHTNITFDLESKGTAYGIGALIGGYCDIAGASQPMGKAQQEIADIRGVHIKEYVLGSYSVSVLVNAANPVSNLSSNQIAALFTGKIQNWKKVGGADAPVHLIARDPVSGTYLGFKEIAMGNQEYGEHVQFCTNYSSIAEAVARDPQSIGYVGLEMTSHAGTKIISIDGVAPSAATVNSHHYPYGRALRFYTDADKEATPARAFVDFALSPPGQQVLTELGYAPKP